MPAADAVNRSGIGFNILAQSPHVTREFHRVQTMKTTDFDGRFSRIFLDSP
jgi:hypothetical protein